jgi:hypothetical protein
VKIWYDWEFLEDGRTILPISVGMVREDGKTLYAVNDQLLRPPTRLTVPPDYPYARVCASDWLMRNVVPHLPLKSRDGQEMTHKTQSPTGAAFFSLDPEHPAVLPLRLIRAQVREFVLGVENPELWSWYSSYDHLVLCQLFGKMIDLPEGFPMHTNDVMTLATLAGGRQPDEPPQEGATHDVLADAWHHKRLWSFYTERLAEQREARYLERHKKAFLGNWPTDEERPTIPVFEIP